MIKKPIDILQMELDRKLPHWLMQSQKNPGQAESIRRRNRDKWRAEQTAKIKAKG